VAVTRSKIEWTDATWSPVRGCSLVSPGCTNCYAMRLAHRFSGKGRAYEGLTRLTKHGPVWTGKVRLVPELLDQPLHWKKPRRIFVNSMSDLFHEAVPNEFIDIVFAVMATAKKHIFQVLTKRPERMVEYFREPVRAELIYDAAFKVGYKGAMCGGTKAPIPVPNVHLGVSCEDQETADERIPLLLQAPAAVRFISYEPALAGVDVTEFLWGKHELVDQICQNCPRDADCECGYETRKCLSLPSIDWIIVGGESGPGARPMHIQWARDIVAQCKTANVACFVKQLGARVHGDPREFPTSDWSKTRAVSGGPDAGYIFPLRDRKGGDWDEWPKDLKIREFPKTT
jgi:protein gp37